MGRGIALGERVARKTYASRAMSAAYETSSDGCAREGQGNPSNKSPELSQYVIRDIVQITLGERSARHDGIERLSSVVNSR
jgi:hypothetical protein